MVLLVEVVLKNFMFLQIVEKILLLFCDSCDYGANIEAATRKKPNVKDKLETIAIEKLKRQIVKQ